ncbi:MAG: hypothetical protein K0R05_384 [Anaerocolumna sp.]|jgi:hypothetical protein|nr:hypothetical protein [Anaerocolumna sp.]
MEDKRVPTAGQLFLNKEKKLLQFILIAADKDNQKDIAVYQELSGDYKVYAKDLSSFLTEMLPYTTEMPEKEQTIEMEHSQPDVKVEAKPIVRQNEVKEIEVIKAKLMETTKVSDDNETVSPILLDFLDADTYEEKLNVLIGGRKNLTDRIVNHMAISIDCIVEDGDMEDRVNSLIYCLKTHARFEDKRLR